MGHSEALIVRLADNFWPGYSSGNPDRHNELYLTSMSRLGRSKALSGTVCGECHLEFGISYLSYLNQL